MHFSYNKVYLTSDLKALIESADIEFDPQFIAVEGLVFDTDNKWILMRRGPGCRDEQFKLEGIGGRIDNENDLAKALYRELEEEAGCKADIKVISPFEIRTDTVYDSRLCKTITWIIVSFICAYKGGELEVREPTKNLGYQRFLLSEIVNDDLSSSAKSAFVVLQDKWDEVKDILAEAFYS